MRIDRVAFTLFGRSIYWYGVIIAAAVLLGTLLACRRERRAGLSDGTVLNFVLLAIPAALVCARIYYVAFSWDLYKDNLLSVFNVRQGGLAIYGGVIGGIAVALLYGRKKGFSFWTLADVCAPSLALGQAIGRWGNFFNQEAFGRLSPASLSFFPLSVYIEADACWHLATFFYESAWCFLLVLALLLLERIRFFKRRGDVFAWYVLLYGFERAVVEGLRTDSLYWGTLRVSQLLSAAILAVFAVCFLLRAKKAPLFLRVLLPLFALAFTAAGALGANTLLLVLLGAACMALSAMTYAKIERTQS